MLGRATYLGLGTHTCMHMTAMFRRFPPCIIAQYTSTTAFNCWAFKSLGSQLHKFQLQGEALHLCHMPHSTCACSVVPHLVINIDVSILVLSQGQCSKRERESKMCQIYLILSALASYVNLRSYSAMHLWLPSCNPLLVLFCTHSDLRSNPLCCDSICGLSWIP